MIYFIIFALDLCFQFLGDMLHKVLHTCKVPSFSSSSLIGGITRISLYCSKLLQNSFSTLKIAQIVLRTASTMTPRKIIISKCSRKEAGPLKVIWMHETNHQNRKTVFCSMHKQYTFGENARLSRSQTRPYMVPLKRPQSQTQSQQRQNKVANI